jgi:hypothetical protein
MRKKNYSEGEEWKRFEGSFEKVCKEKGFDPKNFDYVKLVNSLVNECAEMQHEICSCADVVNIDMFKTAQELTKVDEFTINKNTWNEFINKAILLKKTSVSDKSIEKAAMKAKEMEYLGQLRTAVNTSFVSGSGDIDIISEVKSGLEDDNKKKSSDFMKLIEDAADIRINIRGMYKRYYEYSRVFQYVTNGRYTHTEFKQMVDSVAYGFAEKNKYGEHHVDNAVRFTRTYKCMDEFGYKEFDAIIKDHGSECKVIKEEDEDITA